MPAIDLDDLATWPTVLASGLAALLPDVRQHWERRAEWDKSLTSDWERRLQLAPSTGFEASHHRALHLIDHALASHEVVGYHCTRLCPDEITDIKANGLSALDPKMVSRRIQARVQAGDIGAGTAKALLAANQSSTSATGARRNGLLWFVLSRSLLRDESGMRWLLEYWGGEAIYWAHAEHGNPVGNALMRVGEPCIVEVWLDPATLRVGHGLTNHVLWTFAHANGIKPPTPHPAECRTSSPVPPTHISSIYRRGTTTFDSLTGASSWSPPL